MVIFLRNQQNSQFGFRCEFRGKPCNFTYFTRVYSSMNSMCWVFNGNTETALETDAVGEPCCHEKKNHSGTGPQFFKICPSKMLRPPKWAVTFGKKSPQEFDWGWTSFSCHGQNSSLHIISLKFALLSSFWYLCMSVDIAFYSVSLFSRSKRRIEIVAWCPAVWLPQIKWFDGTRVRSRYVTQKINILWVLVTSLLWMNNHVCDLLF